jgi:protein-disulfide isomerase
MPRLSLALAALAVVGWAPALAAQPADDAVSAIRKELESLKAGQAALYRELQEIKSLLRGREAPAAEAPANLDLSLDGAPVKGDEKARLVLVEFTDYECPFCARHVRQTLPQIEAEYVTSGKMRYAVRDFPLEAVHARALPAAEAARCAGDQGQFWQMHQRLFSNQRALSAADLRAHAGALGLDPGAFEACMQGGAHVARIRADFAAGTQGGVRGTPTFFIGLQEPGSPTVKVLRVIRGAVPFATFKAALDEALAASKP